MSVNDKTIQEKLKNLFKKSKDKHALSEFFLNYP